MKSVIVTITAVAALLGAYPALADGPAAKTPPHAPAAAAHHMCGDMGKMPSAKGHAQAAPADGAKPMAEHARMCGGSKMDHGRMAPPKAGGHAPPPKTEPPKGHGHE